MMYFNRLGGIKIETAFLLLIILLALSIRLLWAPYGIVDSDEAYYTYDALLVLDGKVPTVDYWARSPAFVYMVASFIGLFGQSLFAARLLSVAAALITTVFVYLIARRLYGAGASLLAPLLFALSPFVLRWGTSAVTEPTQVMFVSIAMYSLLLGLQKRGNMHFALSGAMLAVAAMTRLSTLVFLITVPVLLLYIYRNRLAEAGRHIAALFAGFFALYLIPILGMLLLGSTYSSHFLYGIQKMSFGASLRTLLVLAELGSHLAVTALYLFVPVCLFLALALWGRMPKKRRTLLKAGFVIIAAAYLVRMFMQVVLPGGYLWGALYVLCFASIIAVLRYEAPIRERVGYANAFVLFWFCSVLLFHIVFGQIYIVYLLEFSAVASIMSAVVLCALWRAVPSRMLSGLLFAVLLVSGIFAIGHYIEQDVNFTNIQRMSTLQNVAQYISSHTAGGEEVFTAWPIYAFQAKRRAAADIVRSYTYLEGTAQTKMGYPDEAELISYLEGREIKYVLIDFYVEYYIFKACPNLREYVYANYELEEHIDNIKIYRARGGSA